MSTTLLERPAAVSLGRKAAPLQRITEAEYFALDNAAQQRSEWIDGERIVMPGGTEEHGTILACGSRVYDAFDVTTLVNPTGLVEVLSYSTEKIDRGVKLRNYCALPSLRTYLMVSQPRAEVEQYERNDSGGWNYTVITGLSRVIDLPAIGCQLLLTELYEELDVLEGDEGIESETSG